VRQVSANHLGGNVSVVYNGHEWDAVRFEDFRDWAEIKRKEALDIAMKMNIPFNEVLRICSASSSNTLETLLESTEGQYFIVTRTWNRIHPNGEPMPNLTWKEFFQVFRLIATSSGLISSPGKESEKKDSEKENSQEESKSST